MLFLCSQQGNKGYLAIREWSIRSQSNCYLALDEGPKEHKDRDPCSYDKVEEIPQSQPSHLPQCHLFDLQAQPVPLAVQLSFKANKDHLQGYRGTHTSKWQSEMLSVSLTSIEGGMGGPQWAQAYTGMHACTCTCTPTHLRVTSVFSISLQTWQERRATWGQASGSGLRVPFPEKFSYYTPKFLCIFLL